jgi:hypothetical protein
MCGPHSQKIMQLMQTTTDEMNGRMLVFGSHEVTE